MKYMKIIIIAVFVAGLCSCDRDEIFEKEQYKNGFALVSEDGYNIFSVVHDLEEAESIGYVAASCGGTNPTEKNIDIRMELSEDFLDKYNKSNFDMSSAKYAQLLSPDKYRIDNWNFSIPAGEVRGLLPITIKPNGLSPDSVYFIPLRVSGFTEAEVNPDKSAILYRVLIKNRFATQKTATNYAMSGIQNGNPVMGVKTMHPISGNKVRIMAGTISFEADANMINKSGIFLEVDENNHVNITPVRTMNVTQVDDDPLYKNDYAIVDDGYKLYKTFRLRYDYKVGNTTYQMSEELRLEYNPNKEDE
jgi:hypothetical protein